MHDSRLRLMRLMCCLLFVRFMQFLYRLCIVRLVQRLFVVRFLCCLR